jgi:hypothetical protein
LVARRPRPWTDAECGHRRRSRQRPARRRRGGGGHRPTRARRRRSWSGQDHDAADATLRLRASDPSIVATYAEHGRIAAGDLGDQIVSIADTWLECHRRDVTLSITTTRNEDVDEINRHIQQRRLWSGQLDSKQATTIVGGTAFVGDVVATRHNDRSLRTTDGDQVRNRELWRIEAIDLDRSIVLFDGDRRVRLPAEYVEQFVTLATRAPNTAPRASPPTRASRSSRTARPNAACTWERHAAGERT